MGNETLADGYYWISVTYAVSESEPFIAMRYGGNWWRIGDDNFYDSEDVIVLSGRLVPPTKETRKK